MGRALSSVYDLERRAILRPRAPVIVDARGGDIGVTEPFLHLGDVGLMIERVGGGGRAQRNARQSETPAAPNSAEPGDRRRGDRVLQSAGAVVADRPEQRAGLVEAVLSEISWYFHYLTRICKTRTTTCTNFVLRTPARPETRQRGANERLSR